MNGMGFLKLGKLMKIIFVHIVLDDGLENYYWWENEILH